MATNKHEYREHFTKDCVHMREGSGKDSRIIDGDAIVFNSVTTLYEDVEIIVREVILPSCITPQFLAQQDIKLNLLHQRDTSFARNNKGAGTLSLILKRDRLSFSTVAPKCDLGDRAIELIKNRTYTGCSFEFQEGEYDREEKRTLGGKTEILYTHKSFKSISALTIAMDPAYTDTTIANREKSGKMSLAKAQRVAKLKAEAHKLDDFLYGTSILW